MKKLSNTEAELKKKRVTMSLPTASPLFWLCSVARKDKPNLLRGHFAISTVLLILQTTRYSYGNPKILPKLISGFEIY